MYVFSFSGPRVGNTRFKARLERELGVYVHVGADLSLDHRVSPYLKAETLDLVCFHNLEAHLHLLDGYQGRAREFRLEAHLHLLARARHRCSRCALQQAEGAPGCGARPAGGSGRGGAALCGSLASATTHATPPSTHTRNAARASGRSEQNALLA